MALRYEEATDEARGMRDEAIAEHSGGPKIAKIAALFDTKKHAAGGRMSAVTPCSPSGRKSLPD
jgi:hypothetical protein